MAVEIAHDRKRSVAVLFCNTSDTAFGPIFTGPDADVDAEQFLEWLEENGPVEGVGGSPINLGIGTGRFGTDPRDYTPDGLQNAVNAWRQTVEGHRLEAF